MGKIKWLLISLLLIILISVLVGGYMQYSKKTLNTTSATGSNSGGIVQNTPMSTPDCDKYSSDGTCLIGIRFPSMYIDPYDNREIAKVGECKYLAKWYVEQRKLFEEQFVIRQSCE
jgi:hypothetical protein